MAPKPPCYTRRCLCSAIWRLADTVLDRNHLMRRHWLDETNGQQRGVGRAERRKKERAGQQNMAALALATRRRRVRSLWWRRCDWKPRHRWRPMAWPDQPATARSASGGRAAPIQSPSSSPSARETLGRQVFFRITTFRLLFRRFKLWTIKFNVY